MSTPDLHTIPALDQLPEWTAFEQAVQAAPLSEQLRILSVAGIDVDMTAQRHNKAYEAAAEALLKARHFEHWRAALLQGDTVNVTEDRGAWHSHLRAPQPAIEVEKEQQRMQSFIRRADANRQWRNIIHIGIGGSDWGVRLLTSTFGYKGVWRNLRILSNIDGHAIQSAIAGLDPHDTLVVVASKSFGTLESRYNADRLIEWLRQSGIENPFLHVVAITAKPEEAKAWGVPAEHIFPFWDWVGGRFSIWSSLGLSAGLVVGPEVLAGLKSGAHAVDQHFLNEPIERNIPVQMALSAVANRSVLGLGTLNLSIYDSRLRDLIPYLQQLEMESLGKSCDTAGQAIRVPTGAVVWGMTGTDGQHTFYQWLHQSSEGATVDFIMCLAHQHAWPEHHEKLLANCLAQREALLKGKPYEQAYQECLEAGMNPEKAAWMAKHRTYQGGRPSNLIVLHQLNPFNLGALLAIYEHKVFVQSLIWGINAFDQWGVEFGKVLSQHIGQELEEGHVTHAHDVSTQHWVEALIGKK